jgi:hypothetical protein
MQEIKANLDELIKLITQTKRFQVIVAFRFQLISFDQREFSAFNQFREKVKNEI